MKPPEQVFVGHVAYDVDYDTGRCEDAGANGLSSGDRATITLRDDHPPQTQRMVMLHELLHQCLYVAGFSLEDISGVPAHECEKVEEAVIRSMAGPLLGVLRDNAALIKFLVADA